MTVNVAPAYAQTFVDDISQGVPLEKALKTSIDNETNLRRLFATDRNNPILDDPNVGLIDVYGSKECIKRVHARNIENDEDRNAKYIFPLSEEKRLKNGDPAMAQTIDQFRASWNIFTEGALSQLTDWSNVVAAGGAVVASLVPLPSTAQASKRAIRKYFHEETHSASDVDLFLYGLTPEEVSSSHLWMTII